MFNRFRQSIRKYFGISRLEANGILVLIVFTIGMVLSPLLYRGMLKRGYIFCQADSVRLDSLIGLINSSPVDFKYPEGSESVVDSIFHFDPNQITFHQMMLLGFDTLIARRIIKYRNRGGLFTAKEDLLNIYDLPDSMFQKLKGHIMLPDRALTAQSSAPVYAPDIQDAGGREDQVIFKGSDMYDDLSLNINSADTGDFMKIRGIGPVLSRRIIKYRELLGGYSNIGQLENVYGLKGEVLKYLKAVAYVDPMFKPVMIQINYGTWNEMVRHPYIDSQLANDIINLRSEKGYLKDEDDLRNIPYMSDSMLVVLRPYIEF